jgi:predicted nucleic acid-binding protein
MRFWDSSAIVPLTVSETSSVALRGLLAEDPEMVVWWSTEIECVSALARRERERQVSGDDFLAAMTDLTAFAANWQEVAPTREVRETAKRLLRLHPLRGADALQLAAALAVAENDPASLSFVTLDLRLRDAASRHGFLQVLP